VTKVALEAWLRKRLDATDIEVTDLDVPRAGFSNETVLGRAAWRGASGSHDRPFVLRIEATGHQLYPESDALRQAAIMQALGGRVPVPSIWLAESDPAVLGAPFFLMDRVEGHVPPDLPSHHKRGWVADLPPDHRALLYDNGLAAMAQLHAVDWRDGLRLLEPPGTGSALDRYLVQVRSWYDWCASAIDIGAEHIHAAMTHVVEHRPHDPGAVISWGDARVGNIIYAGDLSVAALVDWEAATIAPACVDLGWWLMFDRYLSDAQGVARLEGVPGPEATVARYEALAGAPVPDIAYYELLAALVFSLINSRLFELLLANELADRSAAEIVMGRVTGMIASALASRSR
jgi:aminoglycoside phosphotransferase (APT) family kinase protein